MTIARTRLAVLVAAAAAVAAVFATAGDATSSATAPSPTSAPVISGTLQQGHTIQTSTGSWTGTTPMTYTYQWARCSSGGGSCSVISGATGSTYTLTASDVGHSMRSRVTAKNSAGSKTAESNHSAVVKGSNAPVNTALPSISGTLSVGATVTASNGTWSGTEPITYTYQWRLCDKNGTHCHNISDAEKNAYTLRNADEGGTIRVYVTATNSGGQAAALSGATGVVTATAPVNVSAPTISGTPTEGQTLTAANGTWTGKQPITYTYLWVRCDGAGNNCVDVPSSNDQTFLIQSGSVGHKLKIKVTAKNSVGSTTVESAAVGPVVSNSTLPPGAVKLANGQISIPAASIGDSDRLTIVSVKYSGGAIHGRGPVTATVKVIDDNKYVVSGALVYLLPAPRNFATHPGEVPTSQNGTATLSFSLTRYAPHKGSLMLFIRARTPQGNLLAGSSTRRLVQVRIFPS